MKELTLELNKLLKNTNGSLDIIEAIQNEKAIFPFTNENRLLAYFLSIGEISYDTYLRLDNEYCKRNKYLYLFDMSPRTYGQTWGEQHIRSLFPEFVKATKENLSKVYPSFDGEFDLWLEGIRVEVKACRANSTCSPENLASRAYSHAEAQQKGFKYHFQQLKPSCCDVFIWIGTCKDELLYWILTSEELQKTGKLASQHRNENTGITRSSVFEGQVFMTEKELEPFWVNESELLQVVLQKGKK